MRILALDLAVNTGWALGLASGSPQVGAQRLKQPREDTEVAPANLARFIRDICFIEADRPDLIVYEAAMPLFNGGDGRQREIRRSHESMVMPGYLVGAVIGIAACYGIDTLAAWPATWRKHFLGRSNFGDRDETKRQTISRCHLLGYLHPSCRDDNQADSAGIWDWAAHHRGRRNSGDLALFDEGRMRHG